MKILFATESYWPNHDGGSLFEHALVLDLVKRGHEVRVLAPSVAADGREENEHDHGSIVYRVRSHKLLINQKYRITMWPFRRVSVVIDEFNPDVIHIHNAAMIGLAVQRVARKRGIKMVATNHFMPENLFTLVHYMWLQDFFDRTLGWLVWRYLVWFHNRADMVTSPTHTAVQLLVDRGLTAPHQAISNGVDVTRFRPVRDDAEKKSAREHFHLPLSKPIVLYTGRLDPEKRLDLLIAATPLICKHVDAHVVLAGYGKELERLTTQARKLGVADHVTFLGKVPDEHWIKVYHAADVFTISSPAELQSIVTLEALASGLPVVATRVAALPEIVHDGVNGFLFAKNDVAAMAQHLITLLKDSNMRAAFSTQSRAQSEPHAQSLVFDQFEQLYLTLTSKTKS